jgi:hypothetical protein
MTKTEFKDYLEFWQGAGENKELVFNLLCESLKLYDYYTGFDTTCTITSSDDE